MPKMVGRSKICTQCPDDRACVIRPQALRADQSKRCARLWYQLLVFRPMVWENSGGSSGPVSSIVILCAALAPLASRGGKHRLHATWAPLAMLFCRPARTVGRNPRIEEAVLRRADLGAEKARVSALVIIGADAVAGSDGRCQIDSLRTCPRRRGGPLHLVAMLMAHPVAIEAFDGGKPAYSFRRATRVRMRSERTRRPRADRLPCAGRHDLSGEPEDLYEPLKWINRRWRVSGLAEASDSGAARRW